MKDSKYNGRKIKSKGQAIQHYTYTCIRVREQRFYCCSLFDSHSSEMFYANLL